MVITPHIDLGKIIPEAPRGDKTKEYTPAQNRLRSGGEHGRIGGSGKVVIRPPITELTRSIEPTHW